MDWYMKVFMADWFPIPTKLWSNMDAQLSQNGLGKSHPMSGERKTQPLRLHLQWMCSACWHQAGHKLRADSERRLPPPVWLHSFQKPPSVSWETHIHLTKCGGKTEWGRWLGKLSTCRNWSIWHTVGRNISETCSLQMSQRKIQNKKTQQGQGWDLFFNNVYNAQISSGSRGLILHWTEKHTVTPQFIKYKADTQGEERDLQMLLKVIKQNFPCFGGIHVLGWHKCYMRILS